MLNRQALSNPAFIDKLDAAMRQAAATSLAQSIELPSTTLATGRANVDNRRHRPALTVAHIRNQPGAFRFYDMTAAKMKNITPLVLEVLREHSDKSYYDVAADIRECGHTSADALSWGEAVHRMFAGDMVHVGTDGRINAYTREETHLDGRVDAIPLTHLAKPGEGRSVSNMQAQLYAAWARKNNEQAGCTCAGMHGTHAVWCMATQPKPIDYDDLRAFINGSRQP